MGKRGVTLPKQGSRGVGADGALMVAGLVALHIIDHPGRWVLSSPDWPGRDLEMNVGAPDRESAQSRRGPIRGGEFLPGDCVAIAGPERSELGAVQRVKGRTQEDG